MTESAKFLENTKQEIRSILLAAPKGLPLPKFFSEYKGLIGRSLPFRELGFNVAEEFLASIPDVVNMNWIPHLNGYLLIAVADEKTKHIEKLVSKQKVGKTVPLLRKPRYSSSFCNTFSPPPRMHPTIQPFLPAKIKMEINRVMTSYSEGINFPNFLFAYKRVTGKDLNYKNFGFYKLEECLKSIGGLTIRNVNQEQRIFLQAAIKNSTYDTASRIKPQLQQAQAIPRESSKKKIPECIPPQSLQKEASKYPNPNTMDKLDEFSQADEKKHMSDTFVVSDTMQHYFKKILKTHPHGIWAARFCDAYRELSGASLDLSELGYFSLIELVDCMPETFKRYQPVQCKSDWLLFSADTPMEEIVRQDTKSSGSVVNSSAIAFIENIITNIKSILQGNSEGVFLSDFIHLYSINCDEALQLDCLGFDNVEGFLLSIADRVPLKIDYSSARKKVHFIPPTDINLSTVLTYGVLERDIPSDAVLPGAEYEFQTLPTTILSSTSYFPVLLGTVARPDCFWIQLKGEETSNALEILMSELHDFYYGRQGDLYKMEHKHIMIGAICAGTWTDNNFHRIYIISVEENTDFVLANYVDYGTRERVQRSKLRYLREDFLKLPAQALKSRLAFIKPANGNNWDSTVRDRFLSLTMDRTLMAQLYHSPYYPGFLNLWLCDTNGDDDIHLNKLLVHEGFAVHCSEIRTENDPRQPSRQTWNTSTVPNFAVTDAQPSSIFDQINIIKAFSSFLEFQKAASTLKGNEALFSSLIQALSPGAVSNKAQSSDLNHLQKVLAGADTSLQQQFFDAFSNQLAVSGSSNFPQQTAYPGVVSHNNQRVMNSQYGSPPYFRNAESGNAFGVHGPTAQHSSSHSDSSIKPPVYPHIANMHDTNISSSYKTGYNSSNNSSEIFDDEDDDEAFTKFCEKVGTCSQRYVKRVKLNEGYKIHIILIEKKAYVSQGDISHLFWSKESSDTLSRRLRGKDISFNTVTILEDECPELFRQLRSFRVKGIGNEKIPTVTLYALKALIDILNLFGHPSSTIRQEIWKELQTLNPLDAFWKEFSALDIEDSDDTVGETDNDKFNRMCMHDLKASQEGLRFKRLRIVKGLSTLDGNKSTNPVEELEKIEAQFKVIEKRIKEIEKLSSY